MEVRGGGGREGGTEGGGPGHLGRLRAPWGLPLPLCGPFWAYPGASWAVWGSSCAICRFSGAVLALFWGVFGGLGAVLRASSTFFEHWKLEDARKRKSSNKPMHINDLGLFGLSRDVSRSSLGPSWRPLGHMFKRFRAVLGSLGALLGHLGALLNVSRPPLMFFGALRWARNGRKTHQCTLGAP